jgi:transcriptional regulator with XRE-family HTH domain
MSDESWRKLDGTWDRLKWARKRKYGTARAAAEAMGIPENTYRAYERQPDSSKHIPLTHVHAGHFAKRLGVRWEWLLMGEGQPFADPASPDARIQRALDGKDEGQKGAIADLLERMFRTGTEG